MRLPVPDFCTIERLKAENARYIDGFRAAGERVVLIGPDYERTAGEIVDFFQK